MSRAYIPQVVRDRVAAEARYRCGYCQTQQSVVGVPMQVDHIIPEAADGSSELDNLVMALKMNQPYVIRASRRWVSVGWHPPKD